MSKPLPHIFTELELELGRLIREERATHREQMQLALGVILELLGEKQEATALRLTNVHFAQGQHQRPMTMPLGYLDIYDKLRTWQHELQDAIDELRPGIEDSSIEALKALDRVFYLVEGQLVRDADGAN